MVWLLKVVDGLFTVVRRVHLLLVLLKLFRVPDILAANVALHDCLLRVEIKVDAPAPCD
jgi:hypothetical protein